MKLNYFFKNAVFIILLLSGFNILASPTPLIIDTDMGLDDWWAISYLMQTHQPIKAIIIDNNGVATCQAPNYYAAQNAKALIKLTHFPSIPIACANTPVPKGFSFTPEVRRDVDLHPQAVLPKTIFFKPKYSSQQSLKIIIKQYPKVNILAIGTATTLAHFIKTQPLLARHIQHIYFMAGALYSAGNLQAVNPKANAYAECNVAADVIGMATLMRSHIPITLFPLDLSNQYPISIYDAKYRFAQPHNALQLFLKQTLSMYFSYTQKNQMFYWDVLAAIGMEHPEFITYQKKLNLCINKNSNSSQYGRLYVCKHGAKINVVFAMDHSRLLNEFFKAES